ncbi:MAG: hypothetical protein HY782_04770 [Chloroflexi bacterium]|nr:hypothetical protein [Chloroflexota bacterium]
MSKRTLILILAFILLLIFLDAALIFRLQETPQLTGVVRDADTRAPLEGVSVIAGEARGVTNARGEYALPFVRDDFLLTATLDGYRPAQRQVNGADLLANASTLELDLAANLVTGYVLDAETNQTLPGAFVQVGERPITTNAQGAFEIRAVKRGTLFGVQSAGYQLAVITFDGESLLNISLIPNTIAVVVTDPSGAPIANVKIEAGDQSGTTDAQGRVMLRRVKPGVTVRATAPGFDAATANFSGNDVKLALRPNVLDGIVRDAASGLPISNTLVYIGNTIVATNAQGAYHVDNPPANATIAFKAPGYRKNQIEVAGASRRDVTLQPFAVKAIHIPFGTTPERVRANLDLVAKTELNAVVLSVKGEGGSIAWESRVPLAKEIQAAYLNGIALPQVIGACRANNIYCIARLPVFQDTLLATARPDLALRFPNGKIYKDNETSAWTSAANATVWEYNIALAKEVAAFGFDEIQFDYIRFPGQVSGLYAGALATEDGRVAAVAGFLARAQKELRPTGVFISADVFGLTAATNEDQSTGQRLRDLGPYVDYISPMVYPDVWSGAAYLLANGLRIGNCQEAVRCPYDVIFNSYKRSAEKTATKVRLWLQAYAGRGNYGIAQYKLQKQAAEEAGSAGWMFWSGVGNYDARMFEPK